MIEVNLTVLEYYSLYDFGTAKDDKIITHGMILRYCTEKYSIVPGNAVPIIYCKEQTASLMCGEYLPAKYVFYAGIAKLRRKHA